jgi:hypothetical protein
MTKNMIAMCKKNRQEAVELIQYANPKSKSRPTIERVTEILNGRVLYSGKKPEIISIIVKRYNRNSIIRSAQFTVTTSEGRTFTIDAYQHLKGRTQEEKEADKVATFPSLLFNTFSTEVK